MFGEVAVEMASIEEEAEFNLFKHPEVFLYKVPPQVSAAGHKCVRARGVRAGVRAWRLARVPMCPCACVRVRARRRAKDWGAEVGLAKMEVTAKGKVATIKLTDGKCARLCRLGFFVCTRRPARVRLCGVRLLCGTPIRKKIHVGCGGTAGATLAVCTMRPDGPPAVQKGACRCGVVCVCVRARRRRRALNGAPNARARAPQ